MRSLNRLSLALSVPAKAWTEARNQRGNRRRPRDRHRRHRPRRGQRAGDGQARRDRGADRCAQHLRLDVVARRAHGGRQDQQRRRLRGRGQEIQAAIAQSRYPRQSAAGPHRAQEDARTGARQIRVRAVPDQRLQGIAPYAQGQQRQIPVDRRRDRHSLRSRQARQRFPDAQLELGRGRRPASARSWCRISSSAAPRRWPC